MKILITGANGFLGRNLIEKLGEEHEIYAYDVNNAKSDLLKYTADCDFVYNFAAVHRPKETTEFDKVNHLFFEDLLDMLIKQGNACDVLYTSSIQAINGSEYGNSKLAAEQALRLYSQKTGKRGIIYRLTNTFGKWAMPNHHSVVATFCYNLTRNMPIYITNADINMNFYYIDDVVDSFALQLKNAILPDNDGIFRLPQEKVYTITLGELADTLTRIKKSVDKQENFNFKTSIEEKLYLTYMSYYKETK